MSTRLRCLMTTLAILLVASVIVPSSYAQNRLAQILSVDNSSGAFLGIEMTNVTEENMSDYKLDRIDGVIITSVEEGSPAEAADLKKDDVLLEFDGLKVRSSMQLYRLVQETPIGRKVELLISRDGKRKNVDVRLQERNERQAGMNFRMLPDLSLREPGNRNFLFRVPDSPDRGVIAEPRAPRLGVAIQPLSEQLAEYLGVPGKKGLLVSSVTEGSPAFGKLKAGDVIISADGKDIETGEDLVELARDKTEGSIALKVIRDKKEVAVTINMTTNQDKGFRL